MFFSENVALLFKILKMSCSNKELLSDRALTLNIRVKKNDTFSEEITMLEDGSAFDFTNYDVARMQVKNAKTDAANVLELTILNTRLVLGGALGTITFLVDDADMDITAGTYVYDLEIENTGTGEVETILEGQFIVSQDVTR
jgi:hypothetical protein